MVEAKQNVRHPTTGQIVTVVRVTEFKNHRMIYFKAYGQSGSWKETKQQEGGSE